MYLSNIYVCIYLSICLIQQRRTGLGWGWRGAGGGSGRGVASQEREWEPGARGGDSHEQTSSRDYFDGWKRTGSDGGAHDGRGLPRLRH